MMKHHMLEGFELETLYISKITSYHSIGDGTYSHLLNWWLNSRVSPVLNYLVQV